MTTEQSSEQHRLRLLLIDILEQCWKMYADSVAMATNGDLSIVSNRRSWEKGMRRSSKMDEWILKPATHPSGRPVRGA